MNFQHVDRLSGPEKVSFVHFDFVDGAKATNLYILFIFYLCIVYIVNMSSEVQDIAARDSNSTNPLQNSLNKSSQTLTPSKNAIESKVVLLGDTGKPQRIFLRHLQI